MEPDTYNARMRELLTLTTRLRELGCTGLAGCEHEPHQRRRCRAVLARLRETLGDDGQSALDDLARRHDLTVDHQLILMLLLAERIAEGPRFVSGRTLLGTMATDLFELVNRSTLLGSDSPLLVGDMVRQRGLLTDSPLEAEYRIAEWTFHLCGRDLRGESDQEAAAHVPGPYLSSAAHLVDLKRLVELHQIRSAGLFDDSFYREYYPEADTIAADMNPMILQARSAIVEREQRRSEKVRLPVVLLREEFRLKDDEEIVLLALLFHELFTGPPLLDAGELVRLVSVSEEDVFRKRRLLSSSGRLRESGLITVDSEIEGKDMVGEAYVSAWVEERLLEGIDEGLAIDADECATFHRYLKRLRDSNDFYRNL